MTATGCSVQRENGVLRILFDQPERKNALSAGSIQQMIKALELGATDDSLRLVLIRSTGADFCSGADWAAKNRADGPRPRPASIQRRLPLQAHRLIELIMEIQLPVVCAVRGWAAGIGFQMALAADFTIAAEDARFWEPFLERGFSPDSGATWLLPRLVGIARAKELLILGRKISGREAADWGLILKAVPGDELDAEIATLVDRLATGPSVAVGLAKNCLNRSLEFGLTEAMSLEASALELASRTSDFREGLAAFTERRPPLFEGR